MRTYFYYFSTAIVAIYQDPCIEFSLILTEQIKFYCYL